MYKTAGGVIIVISFVMFVFFNIVGTIATGKGYVPQYITIFAIIGFLGMISGSILYFMGKAQEKKLRKQSDHESTTGGAKLFCSKCGSKLESSAKFCTICGSVI
jgi:hypothetical protein